MNIARLTRREAMARLNIKSSRTFQKVVDANPELKHRLPGESRDHYRADVIERMLHPPSRCVAQGKGAI